MAKVYENTIVPTAVIDCSRHGGSWMKQTPLSSSSLIHSKWNTNGQLTCEKCLTSLYNQRNAHNHWETTLACHTRRNGNNNTECYWGDGKQMPLSIGGTRFYDGNFLASIFATHIKSFKKWVLFDLFVSLLGICFKKSS